MTDQPSPTTPTSAPGPARPRRRASWRAKLLLLVISVALALLVAEGVLRWVVPYKLFYKFPRVEVSSVDPADADSPAADPLLGPAIMPEPDYGYRLKRNMVARMSSSEFDIALNTNELGLRNPPIGPKRGLRVLGLGDSFSMGFGVEAEQAFLRLVEREAREHREQAASPKIDQPLEVIDGGVMGYNCWNCLGYLKDRGAELRPDVVVAQVWSPEILPSSRPNAPRLKSQRTTTEWMKDLALRCHLAMLTTECLRSIPWTRGLLFREGVLGRERADAVLTSDLQEDKREQLAVLADGLRQLKGYCDQQGIRLIVLLIPLREQVYPAMWERAQQYNMTTPDPAKVDLDAPDKALRKMTDRLGVTLVDTTAALRAPDVSAGNIGPPGYYFTGYDVHLNARGHQVVADVLYEALCKELAGKAATAPAHGG